MTNHVDNSEELIDKLVNVFIKDRGPRDRYASFDYCYNYFQSFRVNDKISQIAKFENLQISCLQLGFYLASWGMLRGSSFLLQRSVKYYEELIKEIAKFDMKIWVIDADNYTEENIKIILECYKMIVKTIIPSQERSLVIATKIMLGVFGCIPAFDDNFCNGFREIFKGKCGFRSLNKDSLKYIGEFYQNNKQKIDGWVNKIRTIDFKTGEDTDLSYTKTKIIDMIGFTYGLLLTQLAERKQ